MKKIYIIGNVGSGKTTLSKKLSKKYNIKYYELDNVVYDDFNHIKRTEEEITSRFNKMISKDNWIIEDTGRKIFRSGVSSSDITYYIKINKIKIYFRCLKRWIKQKLKLENYNYKPTLKSLIQMLKWAYNYSEKDKIKYIKENSKNYKILTKKDIEELAK